MAACMSSAGAFIATSDLDPGAVPVEGAKAILTLLTVGDAGEKTAGANIFLRYDGPAAFAELE
jgi:hypothetical protein